MKNNFRQVFSLMICICLAFGTAGCSNSPSIISSPSQSESQESMVASYSEATRSTFLKPLFKDLLNAPENSFYQVEDTVLENYPEIHYPQLINTQQGGGNDSSVNAMIQQQLNAVISELGLFDEYETAQKEEIQPSLSVVYEIKTLNQKFLSIEYTSVCSNQVMAHPIINCFTFNLNLEQEEEIRLADMIVISDEFWKEFQASARPVETEEGGAPWWGVYCPPQTAEGIEQLKACDSKDFTENIYPIFSYYANDKLYLCFPKDHIDGAYAIFEMEFLQ